MGALVLRLPGITKPSIEQRETQSALRVRAWYLGERQGLPAWKERVLQQLGNRIGLIEPPVTDFLALQQFRLAGENIWFPRLLSACYWLIGGIFLYLIGRRLTTPDGALFALALYLTWPFAVRHSRLFMPDALLVAFMLAASLAVLRYWERPSSRRLLLAGVVSSAATAVKPGVALFFLGALFVALAVSHRQLRATVLTGRLLLYLGLTGFTAGAYYIWGTRFDDFIWRSASADRFTPESALHGWFWERWWNAVSYLLTFPQSQTTLAVVPIAAALAGILVARRKHARATLVGLLLGYLVFAVAYAYYISGNPYYSLPLIPILALSIGVLAGFGLERSKGAIRVALIATMLVVIAVAAYKSTVILRVGEPEARIADYRRIGDITGHTARALIVDDQLSTPLMYWGWVIGEAWALTYESPPPWIHPERADYLVVVGAFGNWALENHRGLREFSRGLPVVARTDGFAIFDLRARNRATS